MKHTKEGYPIWEAHYEPIPEDLLETDTESLVEGEILSDLLPLSSGSIHLTQEQLKDLLRMTAEAAYNASEQKRQAFATTPDGLRDKTIHGYKPVPHTTALSQSKPLLSVPLTGTETWKGDSINPIPSSCADRLFSAYPNPILLSQRCEPRKKDRRIIIERKIGGSGYQ